MINKKSNTTFYCFSPPVMIATMLIEIFLAIRIIYRYKKSRTTWAIFAILICLSIFQLAEYFVCTYSNYAEIATKLGYVSITLLPALGIYLMSLLTTKLSKVSTLSLITVTSVFVGYFLFVPAVFESYVCTGNYVFFQIMGLETFYYSIFYFGLIISSVFRGLKFIEQNPKSEKNLAIKWFVAGYALFIIPTGIFILVLPDASRAVPSVLCGFAIFMALVLALKVAPLKLNRKNDNK